MNRTVLKPFTFSNGITLPVGTMLCTHQWAVHRDGQNYTNPDEFDGERFLEKDWIQVQGATGGGGEQAEKAEGKGERNSAKKTMYSTSRAYMPFGHGKHAW
jgi:cytochrome P450